MVGVGTTGRAGITASFPASGLVQPVFSPRLVLGEGVLLGRAGPEKPMLLIAFSERFEPFYGLRFWGYCLVLG